MGGGSCDLTHNRFRMGWSMHRKKLAQELLTLQTTYSSNSCQFYEKTDSSSFPNFVPTLFLPTATAETLEGSRVILGLLIA
jgi:hypothetical protein